MVARIVLGSIIFFISFHLGVFLPNFWDLPVFIQAPLKIFVTGVGLSIISSISFFLMFYRKTHHQKKMGKSFISRLFLDNKRIIGAALLVVLLVAIIIGFVVPQPVREKFDLPVIGGIFKPEDPTCLQTRSVLKEMEMGTLFGENATQYSNPEKLEFLLEEYPGYRLKSATIAELNGDAYILGVLTLEGFDEEEMQGADELFNMKLCAVRPGDMKMCDCTGFLGVADIIVGMLKEEIGGTEEMLPEGIELGDLLKIGKEEENQQEE